MEGDFYATNKDFRDFVDANAKAYNKSVEFMLLTPTVNEYKKYIQERDKGRIKNENSDH